MWKSQFEEARQLLAGVRQANAARLERENAQWAERDREKAEARHAMEAETRTTWPPEATEPVQAVIGSVVEIEGRTTLLAKRGGRDGIREGWTAEIVDGKRSVIGTAHVTEVTSHECRLVIDAPIEQARQASRKVVLTPGRVR